MTDPFTDFDAAYVLGALSDSELAAYERHLAGCSECSASVRALSPVPALLAAVPDREWTVEVEGPPDTLLPNLLTEVHRRRRRVWYAGALAAVVAACLLLVTVLVVRQDHPAASHPVAMHSITASPLQATADVRAVAWGTSITLRCQYDATSYPSDAPYSLVAVDRSGGAQQLGTWRVVNGGVTTFASGTALPRSDIKEIQIRVEDTEVLNLPL